MYMSHIRLKVKFTQVTAPPPRKVARSGSRAYSRASLIFCRGLAERAGHDGGEGEGEGPRPASTDVNVSTISTGAPLDGCS